MTIAPPSWRVLEGDARAVLAGLPESSVHCCLTSPPYFGLRDYGVEPSVWDPVLRGPARVGVFCDEHDWEMDGAHGRMRRGLGLADSDASTRGGGKKVAETPDVTAEWGFCRRCEAWLGTLGNEPTVELYVHHLIAVMREVRRVLRPDGTLWLNLGDTYAADRPYQVSDSKHPGHEFGRAGGMRVPDGLKAKDLIGVPWRVAFALQADGWFLRAENIWNKPNALPESVRDRPTKSHEQVFLLAPSAHYHYDAFAVKEDSVSLDPESESYRPAHENGERRSFDGKHEGRAFKQVPDRRNRRDVWTIATRSFPEAHFAVFPRELCEVPIRAGCPETACAACGAPRRRLTEKQRTMDGKPIEGTWVDEAGEHGAPGAQGVGHWRFKSTERTVGWRPTCACGAPEGVLPDDLELIETPTGEAGEEDPSLETGRGGMNRPRSEEGGTRPVTRYEQRRYAEQLRAWDPEVARAWREGAEVTDDAWAHYVRTDRAGARPLPPELLEPLLDEGLLERVEPPAPWWSDDDAVPGTVLDPFSGAGTTGLTALREGRSFVGVELNPEYAELARNRIRDDSPLMNVGAEVE